MGLTALAEPQVLKISSKRQITIPAKLYESAGFREYALCTWTKDGLVIQALDVEEEGLSVSMLRQLVSQGFEGEELVRQYQIMRDKIVSVKARLEESERDVAEGRVAPVEGMTDSIREKYGL